MGKTGSLALRIREIRGDQPQQKTAGLLGILKSKWSRWEQGQSEPSVDELVSLCRIFDVSPGWLLGLSDERAPCLPVAEVAVQDGGVCPSCRKKDETIQSLVEMAKGQQATVTSQQKTIHELTLQGDKKTTSSDDSLPSSGARKPSKKTA